MALAPGLSGSEVSGGAADTAPQVDAPGLKARIDSGEKIALIDVRSPSEFAGSRMHGARNIPLEQVAAAAGSVEAGKPLVLICERGVRARLASGAFEGRRIGGMHLRHFHAITPATDRSTTYFFSQARNFKIEDAKLTEGLHKMMIATFNEDKAILEAQDRRLRENADIALMSIKNDAGVLQARRIIEEALAAERPAGELRVATA